MIRTLLTLFIITVIKADDGPFIEISNGWLQGRVDTSYKGRLFSYFEGIPYARPPVGELRFEEPKEPYNWTGTWIANTKHVCLHSLVSIFASDMVNGHEDCLYLNVYVPREKPDSTDNLDVVVHIHGGAFMIGAGHMYAGPKYLMDEEVILVTMNYRLGPLGFLSTEDDVVPGNNGMKDQALSLKWIQKNIEYFGGNPKSVTITGMSAGGASVHLHYFSPLSKDLFHRGFSESGVALNPWVLQEAALEKAKHLATLVGCPTETSRELVDCLKSRSANKIVENVKEFVPFNGFPVSPFAPVIEKKNPGAFLSEHPYKMLIDKTVTDVPWITSVSEQEGILFATGHADNLPEFLQDFDIFAPHLLEYNYTLEESWKPSVSRKIKEHYFKQATNVETIGKLIGDRLFLADADTAAKLQARANKSPVYFYILGYRGQHSIVELYKQNAPNIRASHGDSILYYLNTPISEEKLSGTDENMKSIFMQWLLAFANDEELKVNDQNWDSLQGNEVLQCLVIRSPDDISMEIVEDMGSKKFWRKIPFKENESITKIKDEL